MQDLILGLVAIAAGALFCFAGYLAFRLIIPLWGFFAGFAFGAGLISSITGDGFLRTLLGWAVGLGCALVFALLAYLFYEVAVVVAMGSIGFALGTSIMVALHVSWTWLVVLVGVAVGVLLALGAIVAELPMVLLIVLSALGGASAITMGVMLLVGTTDSADFTKRQRHRADRRRLVVVRRLRRARARRDGHAAQGRGTDTGLDERGLGRRSCVTPGRRA